jgi:hypothetical protein
MTRATNSTITVKMVDKDDVTIDLSHTLNFSLELEGKVCQSRQPSKSHWTRAKIVRQVRSSNGESTRESTHQSVTGCYLDKAEEPMVGGIYDAREGSFVWSRHMT